LVLLLGAAPPVLAAAKSSKPGPAKSARRGVIARDPYLGAIVVEANSGKVLFEDQADARGYPASVLKLMDLLIILEKVEKGELSLRDPVTASAKATQVPESRVELQEGESFPLDEMLYALMVRSANDAAIAVAEKVGGSVEGFLGLMNHKARQLGMTSTVFHSVNGLPPPPGGPHDITTARELSILCREVLKHKDTLRYTSTRERTFRPNAGKRTVKMVTHNHLLGRVEGCDGLKTGYIGASGFSIAVTAARHGQRIIVIVLDSVDSKTRDAKAKELVEKGFARLGESAAKK
jgi:D-alanyl-D-alanine carboxypeptidase (penicillin-binding protein 5/6)